jgi:hypothetical protein
MTTRPGCLSQGLRGVLGLVAPHHGGDERRLLLMSTADGYPEHGPGDAAIGVADLGLVGAKYSPRFLARRLGSPVADPPHGQRLSRGRSRGEQIVLSIQALEAVSAPRLERQSRGALSKVASDTRHEDLAGSRPGHDAGRGMHRQAPDVVAAHDHLAAVDAYADRELYRAQGSDQCQSTADGALDTVEHDEERVAGGLDLAAGETGKHTTDDILVQWSPSHALPRRAAGRIRRRRPSRPSPTRPRPPPTSRGRVVGRTPGSDR